MLIFFNESWKKSLTQQSKTVGALCGIGIVNPLTSINKERMAIMSNFFEKTWFEGSYMFTKNTLTGEVTRVLMHGFDPIRHLPTSVKEDKKSKTSKNQKTCETCGGTGYGYGGGFLGWLSAGVSSKGLCSDCDGTGSVDDD